MGRYSGTLVLFASDVLSFYFSLFLAFLTKYLFFVDWVKSVEDKKMLFLNRYVLQFWWIPLIFVYFFLVDKLYSRKLPFWLEAKMLLKNILLSCMMSLTVVYIANIDTVISKYMFAFFVLYSLFIFPISRFLIKSFAHRLGIGIDDVVILGAGQTALSTLKELENEKYLGYRVIGFLDDFVAESVGFNGRNFPILGKLSDFTEIVSRNNLNTAIFAISSMSSEKVRELVGYFQSHVKNLIVVPDFHGISMMNTELYYLFSEQIFFLNVKNNLKSVLNRFMKRSFDIVFALLLLPFILPLIFILGLFIKLNSRGPIFYSQTRIGANGKAFKVYKFRSMYPDADTRLEELLASDLAIREEWESSFKLKNDPRVTSFGSFLRKTSLDEIPQFFNVLKGEMSFVGPRPVLQKELDDFYSDYVDCYHSVKPGITGLWQVSGRSNTDYDFRVKSDAWYVLNWSLWLDVIILVKTVKVVLKREGAY